MVALTAFLIWRLHRQKTEIQELLNQITIDRDRFVPAVRSLVELLSDIANASAQSGDSAYLLAKRLDRILSSSKGEGRNIKNQFLVLADLYEYGMLSYLRQIAPNLTPGEIGMCGMIMLGLEPLCISRVLGYDHEQTFYNKRTDIRKKLHLDREDSLEGYLSGLIAQLKLRNDLRVKHLKQ